MRKALNVFVAIAVVIVGAFSAYTIELQSETAFSSSAKITPAFRTFVIQEFGDNESLESLIIDVTEFIAQKEYVFFGRMVVKNKRWVMEQPVIYTPEKYGEIAGMLQPVYALTAGVTNNLLIKTIKTVLGDVDLIADYIPTDVRKKYGLCEYNYALKQIHFPDTMENLIEARRCLVFHEFFVFIMGIQYQKEKKSKDIVMQMVFIGIGEIRR